MIIKPPLPNITNSVYTHDFSIIDGERKELIELGIVSGNGHRVEESTEPRANSTNEENLMDEVQLGLQKHKVNGCIYVMLSLPRMCMRSKG